MKIKTNPKMTRISDSACATRRILKTRMQVAVWAGLIGHETLAAKAPIASAIGLSYSSTKVTVSATLAREVR